MQKAVFYEYPKDVVEVKSTIMCKLHPFFECRRVLIGAASQLASDQN